MPYSGPDDQKLPDNVLDRPKPQREAFVAAFNSEHDDCMAEDDTDADECEERAFQAGYGAANAVAEAKAAVDDAQIILAGLSAVPAQACLRVAPVCRAGTGRRKQAGKEGRILSEASRRRIADAIEMLLELLQRADAREEELAEAQRRLEVTLEPFDAGEVEEVDVMGKTKAGQESPEETDPMSENAELEPLKEDDKATKFLPSEESFEGQARAVREAFMDQYDPGPAMDGEWRFRPWVVEVREDSAIVEFTQDEYWLVPYSRADGEVEFAERDMWEAVKPTTEWVAKSRQRLEEQAQKAVDAGGLTDEELQEAIALYRQREEEMAGGEGSAKQDGEEGLSERMERIRDAWRAEYDSRDTWTWVAEVFEDTVIAEIDGEYFRIPYTEEDGEIFFEGRAEWTEVERNVEWIEKSKALRAQYEAEQSEAEPEIEADPPPAPETSANGAGLSAKAQAGKANGRARSRREIEFDIEAPCADKALKVIDEETRRVGAYATIWGEVDCEGETMTRAAVEPSVGKGRPLMLWQHGLSADFGTHLPGEWDESSFRMDEKGLYVEGNLFFDEWGDLAWAKIQEAGGFGLSVGTYWWLVERRKGKDAVQLLDWPLLDVSIMEAGKQCVPNAQRMLKGDLAETYRQAAVKMGYEWREPEPEEKLVPATIGGRRVTVKVALNPEQTLEQAIEAAVDRVLAGHAW